MLIIEAQHELVSNGRVNFDFPGRKALWFRHVPGVFPGSGLQDADRDTLRFAFVSAAASHLAALQAIMTTLMRRPTAKPTEPVLFVAASAPIEIVAEMAANSDRKHEMRVEFTLDSEGELQTLFCGDGTVNSPLFQSFFQNMQPDLGKAHTTPSLEVLRSHLGGLMNA